MSRGVFERIKKYKDIEPAILRRYVHADEYFYIHKDDSDLPTQKIELPKEPRDLHEVEGYGLPAKEQKWKPPKIPIKLIKLEEECESLDDIIDTLYDNPRYYKDEIRWIKIQWHRVINGYWLFINGKPTYLDGWHYFYCGHFNLDIGLPEYRDRDRRWFLFARDCYNTTNDEEGNDMGFRTCYGFNYPKHRRDGATYKVLAVGYIIAITGFRRNFGIQSLDEDNAKEHYIEKLIPAWQKLPFFFKPTWDGTTNPKEQLIFKTPAIRNKKGKSYIVTKDQLGGKINYATTAHKKFYDGKKLHMYQSEEDGKCKIEDVYLRWNKIKETLGQGAGAGIHGFSIHPTTISESKDEGLLTYKRLCDDSMQNERDKLTGRTKSGLFNLFLPAHDGLENFIGPYGESVIGKPTPEQSKYIGRSYGAEEYLDSIKMHLKEKGTEESTRKYRAFCKEYPQSWEECFRYEGAEDSGMPHVILDERIYELEKFKEDTEKTTIIGKYKWIINGINEPLTAEQVVKKGLHYKQFTGKVEFFPDPEGNWKLSKMPLKSKKNRVMMTDMGYAPEYPGNFIASADAYKWLDKATAKDNEGKGRLSDGGGAVFWDRDKEIDPDDKHYKEYESNRFVASYLARPNERAIYAEEQLMSCVFWGAMMYPEMNIEYIWEYFVKRGFGGFLKYDIDPFTGKVKPKPGFYSGGDNKQKIFSSIRDYIIKHGHRERHIDFLKQVKRIRGIEEMTKNDLFTSCGGCLLGRESDYTDVIEGMSKSNDIGDFVEIYEYN